MAIKAIRRLSVCAGLVLAQAAYADCTRELTETGRDRLHINTDWYFVNVADVGLQEAEVAALSSVHRGYDGVPECTSLFGYTGPWHHYDTGRMRAMGSPVWASAANVQVATQRLYQSDIGGGSSVNVSDTGGSALAEGRLYSGADYWYKTDTCSLVHIHRVAAGHAIARYEVEPVSTSGGSKLHIDFAPSGDTWRNTVYPCAGSEFETCEDDSGMALLLQEGMTVKCYNSSGIVISTTTLFGGGTAHRGVMSGFGFASSILDDSGIAWGSSAECESLVPSWTRYRNAADAGVYSTDVSIPMGTVVVGVSYCYWIEAFPSPSTPSSLTCATICFGDLNGDGAVDSADLTMFLDAFDLGAQLADYDGDGGVTIDDLTGFLAAFENGC